MMILIKCPYSPANVLMNVFFIRFILIAIQGILLNYFDLMVIINYVPYFCY